MTDQSYEFVEKWIDDAPHVPGCAAIITQADNCCSCGKIEALRNLSDINPDTMELPGCDGECEMVDKIKDRLRDVFLADNYSTMTRAEVKEEFKDLL